MTGRASLTFCTTQSTLPYQPATGLLKGYSTIQTSRLRIFHMVRDWSLLLLALLLVRVNELGEKGVSWRFDVVVGAWLDLDCKVHISNLPPVKHVVQFTSNLL